jgi:hypothetical protein
MSPLDDADPLLDPPVPPVPAPPVLPPVPCDAPPHAAIQAPALKTAAAPITKLVLMVASARRITRLPRGGSPLRSKGSGTRPPRLR